MLSFNHSMINQKYNQPIFNLRSNFMFLIIFTMPVFFSIEIFNELSIEIENIVKMNRQESLTNSYKAKTLPKGLLLKFKNKEHRYDIIKAIIFHTSCFCKQKIAICCFPNNFSLLFHFIGVLQNAISYRYEDWNKNILIDKKIIIINNIRYLNNNNLDSILLNYLIAHNYEVNLFFYDDYTINNCEIVLNNLSKQVHTFHHFGGLYFYFTFTFCWNIQKYFELFITTVDDNLKKIAKEFYGDIIEIVYIENEFILRNTAISWEMKFKSLSYDNSPKKVIKKEEKPISDRSSCQKILSVCDSLNNYNVNLKFFSKIGPDFKNKYCSNGLNIDSLLSMNIMQYDTFCDKYIFFQLLCVIADEKTIDENVLLRTIKICHIITDIIETYSFFIDKYQNFTLDNFLPENIKETKRVVDMIKRIKINLQNAFKFNSSLSQTKILQDKKCALNESFPVNMYYKAYYKMIPLVFYTDIDKNIKNLQFVLENTNNIVCKRFLFNYIPTRNNFDEKLFDCYKSVIKNSITNIALTDQMIYHQKYSNSFGLRIISTTHGCEQEYFLFLIPSFIQKFNNLDSKTHIIYYQMKFIAKLSFLDDVLIAFYEKHKDHIINHYLILELINNFIYFVYLNVTDKITLIKQVLNQMFQDLDHREIISSTIKCHAILNNLQYQAFVELLSKKILELIDEMLQDFFAEPTDVSFTIVLPRLDKYFESDYLVIQNVIENWTKNEPTVIAK